MAGIITVPLVNLPWVVSGLILTIQRLRKRIQKRALYNPMCWATTSRQ
jgi:hypothetical protein